MNNFNYLPADPDKRDLIFQKPDIPNLRDTQPSTPAVLQLPIGRIESQRKYGSCTSFSLTNAFENLVAVMTGDSDFQASALFNYSQSRTLDSDQLTSDPGTTLRSACGNLRLSGIPRDTTWPYTDSNFTQVPSAEAFKEANQLARVITYFEVKRDLATIKYVLGSLKLFISIGFLVYPSYQTAEVARTGDIPMPTQQELTNGNIGGHSCAIFGWNDDRQVFYVVNNYGTSWGMSGTGSLPYAYFQDPNLLSEAKLMLPSDDFVAKYNEFKNYTLTSSTTTTSDVVPLSTNPSGNSISTQKEQTLYIWHLKVIILLLLAICSIGMVLFWYKSVPTDRDFPKIITQAFKEGQLSA